MALMTVYSMTNDSKVDEEMLEHSIKQLNGSLEIATPIKEIVIYNYNLSTFEFDIIITTIFDDNDALEDMLFFYEV